MWKVGDINPVSVLGVDGYPYGFNLTTEAGQPLLSFAYVTRASRRSRCTHSVSYRGCCLRYDPTVSAFPRHPHHCPRMA